MTDANEGGRKAPLFIAIVGGAPSSDYLAPYDNPDWQIWGMAFRRKSLKRVDRLFEIHDSRKYAKPGYEQEIVSLGIPLVVGRNFPIRAAHVSEFPFERAFQMMPYLTSSAAYMIALAILEGATEIGVYGCDMAVDDAEYFYQRPCVEAWIGYARGLGIKVTVPDQSPLGKSTFLYGADPLPQAGVFNEAEFRSMAEEHLSAMAQIEAQVKSLQDRWNTHSGAHQSYERMARAARAIAAGNDVKHLKDTILIRQ